MQIPGSVSTSSQPSIFEAILEECSIKMMHAQESNHQQHDCHPKTHEIFKDHHEHDSSHMWIWMDETPYESILEEDQAAVEDKNVEYHRVKSLREEQESKIAQFMRDDKYKSLRCITLPMKGGSPVKTSQSLSPRKTKRIDKGKPFRLIHQSD